MHKTMERAATEVVVRPSTYATLLVHAAHRVEATAAFRQAPR